VHYLHRQDRRVSQQEEQSCSTNLVYSSTLKIDAVNASETLVNIYQTALLNIPEDRVLHRHRHKGHKEPKPYGKIVLAAFNFMQRLDPHMDISKLSYMHRLQNMREN
jgi:hypothetical protein